MAYISLDWPWLPANVLLAFLGFVQEHPRTDCYFFCFPPCWQYYMFERECSSKMHDHVFNKLFKCLRYNPSPQFFKHFNISTLLKPRILNKSSQCPWTFNRTLPQIRGSTADCMMQEQRQMSATLTVDQLFHAVKLRTRETHGPFVDASHALRQSTWLAGKPLTNWGFHVKIIYQEAFSIAIVTFDCRRVNIVWFHVFFFHIHGILAGGISVV